MNKQECRKVLEYLKLNYPDLNVTEQLFNMWLEELQQYDYEDVMNKIKEMLASGHFKNQPPVLMSIVNGLTKKSKKIDWSKTVTYCPICNKAFNVDKNYHSDEYEEHRRTCQSIEYVIRQTKKWFNKDLTRAELWAMSKQEFDERYDKLLHYIYDHTDNQDEKDIIGHIFNPPSVEETKEILKGWGIEVEE